MSIESKFSYELNKHPAVKKVIKRAYQGTMYAISPKIKSEGNITRISPDDKDHEYFFGYYDKSPWDITDRYMLCMKANDTWSDVSPKETADILLIDTQKNEDDKERVKKIAETRAWNVQQSCMLQWLGADFSSRVLYNDFRDGKYVSVILTLATMEEKVISAPVYSVSADGKFALTLDFSRLYNLRPGYGYYNVPERTKGVALPDATAIWKVDLETGEVKALLKYTDFASFQPRPEMQEAGAVHKVNHIMLSPNGKRFMVLYRWFIGERKYTRLITCNVDGTDMYVLSDDDMVSHCFWKDDEHIIAFENKKKSGTGYYLMKDKTQDYIHCWPQFSNDGHPSYSPDGNLIVTDSYPDRARVASINLMDGDETKKENTTIARVFAPFKYDNDTRCDLHPRWNHAGDKICFDSIFEGHRGLYTTNVYNKKTEIKQSSNKKEIKGKVSCVIPTYKRSDSLINAIKSVLNQSYKNFEVLVVDDNTPGDEYSVRVQNLISGINDSRVKYVPQKNHINGAAARNTGIIVADGEYIAFLDDDDTWNNSKLKKQIDFLDEHSQIDGVSTYYQHFLNRKVVRRCPPYNCNDIHKKIISREVAVFTSTVMLRRKALLDAGIFNVSLRRHQDLQLLLDFTLKYKLDVLPEYLVDLTMDQGGNRLDTISLIKVKQDFFRVCKKHFDQYSKKEQKNICDAHYFEIIFSAIKSKKIAVAIKYLLKVGISVSSWRLFLHRVVERKKNSV